jgi:exosortase/archaeosortase family protein
VSYSILALTGFQPYQDDATTVQLARFTLNIAVPCSGLKLLIALAAFTVFFMLVANLKWMGNLVLVALWLPLSLLINGLRIAMIGMVGNTWGHDAGMQFHDYSGYLTLLVCFFILFRVARGLGWKD